MKFRLLILRVKLLRLDVDNRRRDEVAKFYLENIRHPDIILPTPSVLNSTKSPEKQGGLLPGHVWHLFVIRCQNRDKLHDYLADNEIQTIIHYPIPPHKQPAYKEWNKISLPLTENIHNQVLSLPISPLMSDKEVRLVAEVINNFNQDIA